MPDYLDMAKYTKFGPYHWLYFKHNEEYRQEFLTILHQFKKLEKYRNRTIIDIGCGDGLWVYLLHKNGYHIIGIDANPLAIELAKSKNVPNVSVGDILTYNNKHDIALLFDVFEHVTNPTLAVSQLDKTIKRRIYILNPLYDSPNHFAQYTTNDLQLLFKKHWVLEHESFYSKPNEPPNKALIMFKRI